MKDKAISNTDLTDQQPLRLPLRIPLLIRQQEARLVLPALDDPLQPLPLRDIMPDHEGLDARLLRPALLSHLVRVDDHIPAPAPVQRVHRPPPVPVERAQRRPRREVVVDGRAGVAGAVVLTGRELARRRALRDLV
mgnify:CR=1 FL=1